MDALDGTPCRAGFRKQRMHEDIATVTTTCQKDQTCPFTGFRLSESCLKFKYVGKIGIFQYTLTFTDDYPENSYLMCDDQHDSLRVFNVPATEIFTILAKEMYQEMSFPRSPSGNFIQNSSVVTDGAEDYSDYSEDDLDDIGEDYYDREEPTSGDSEMLVHPLLKQDMDMVRALFGENAVGFRVFQSIDDMDVDLKLNMAFLETEVARAWRVNPMEPLTVRLHLSMSRYLDHPKPKIEVFIQSQKEKFGAVNQVKKIVENFLLDHWDKLSNNAVLSQYTKDRKFEKCLQKENTRSSEASTNHCANDALVAQLMDLGFSSESSQNALVIARGNVEEAANLLISNPEKCMTMACDAKPFSAIISSIFKPKDPNPLGGQVSEAKLQRSLSSVDPKEMPPLEFGFLVQLYQYCRQRVRTLNEFCVICDEKHAFHSGSMLKPVVCSRELCVFSFQTLGVMSDAADSIAMQAEVVDLLIAMARSACKSSRKLVIFDPFPSVVNPGKPTELALNPKNKEDHMARAESALDSLPPMHEMIRHRQSDLKAELDRLNVLAYPLLTWIISSNRCHIVKLPSHKCSQSMRTPHQFLLLSSAPAKEEAFREAKKKYKSTFAFHGSNIENWHSILRHGLYNATGTKFQCHGSAYGSGIYLSPMSNTSFGYCNKLAIAPPLPPRYATMQKPAGEGRFMYGTQLKCIALCEVIDSDQLKKNGDIWVMPVADHVCTRFFFVYEASTQLPATIDTRQPAFIKEIQKALGSSVD